VLPVPALAAASSPPATSAAAGLSSAPPPDIAVPASLRISFIQSPLHSTSQMSFEQGVAIENDDFQISVMMKRVEYKTRRIYEVSAVTGY
jgi:hypothetical protein